MTGDGAGSGSAGGGNSLIGAGVQTPGTPEDVVPVPKMRSVHPVKMPTLPAARLATVSVHVPAGDSPQCRTDSNRQPSK